MNRQNRFEKGFHGSSYIPMKFSEKYWLTHTLPNDSMLTRYKRSTTGTQKRQKKFHSNGKKFGACIRSEWLKMRLRSQRENLIGPRSRRVPLKKWASEKSSKFTFKTTDLKRTEIFIPEVFLKSQVLYRRFPEKPTGWDNHSKKKIEWMWTDIEDKCSVKIKWVINKIPFPAYFTGKQKKILPCDGGRTWLG